MTICRKGGWGGGYSVPKHTKKENRRNQRERLGTSTAHWTQT